MSVLDVLSIPYAQTATRPSWVDLPIALRVAIETEIGAPVITAQSQSAGFTSGFASVLRTRDGRGCFVKAETPHRQPAVAANYQREAEILRQFPAGLPVPKVLWQVVAADWHAVGFTPISGHTPALPWQPAELAATLASLEQLALSLTPPPPALRLRPLTEKTSINGWRLFQEGTFPIESLDAQTQRDLPALIKLETRWAEVVAGDTVCHLDTRPDNVLIDDQGSAWICDWNWAVVGAAWVDLVSLLPTVHASGINAVEILGTHAVSRDVDPGDIAAFLASFAGYFAANSRFPAPSGISPWLRSHQRAYGQATLALLRELLGKVPIKQGY